jgi:diketogulonate reductase-like aldo/keto reductase
MTTMIWRWPFENLAKTSLITSILQAHLVAPIIILAWIATANVVVIATFYRVLTHHLLAV